MSQPIRLKDHEKDARLVRSRVVVGAVAVVLLVCVLIARLYYLQVIQYDYHSTLSENNRVHVQPIPPTRGLIFDRNGVIVADNRPSFSLTMTRERAGEWKGDVRALVATEPPWPFGVPLLADAIESFAAGVFKP